MSEIVSIELPGGLSLVVEPLPSVASVAVSWLLPAGSASDPADADGHAAMLAEMIFRGAGGLDSKAHSDALDRLGVQRSSHVGAHHLHLTATLLGGRLHETLPLLASMVLEPAFPDSALEAVRSLCLQSLDGLADDPQHLVMLNVRERHLPAPINRHGYGSRAVLEAASIDDLRDAWRRGFRPGGSILAVAGAVDPRRLADALATRLDTWRGAATPVAETARPRRGHAHVEQDTAQMHLGIAYDAPREGDPTATLERVAVAALSGGTSARLFTEVRQKRSLCYSVGAALRAGRDHGLVSLYAGTTPDRAQETLDVCIAEIERLRDGVGRDEFDRAVVGLKSHLVMAGESTAARASALAADLFRIGRARTLAERAAEIDAITFDGLNAYLRDRDFGEYTVASIGPVAPRVPEPVARG